MYYCKIFVLFVYVSVTLCTVECVGTGGHTSSSGGRSDNGQGKAKTQSGGSSNLTSSSNSQDQTSEGTSAPEASSTVTESPLDLKDLRADDQRGLYFEYDLDDWKIKWYRSFVGKNFNKLKLGDTALWPESVTHQSIYELLLFNKDKKYMVSVTTLKPEGYLSTSFFHCEYDETDASKTTLENLEVDKFMEKFQQNLDSKFIEPFPDRLPKDLFYQKYKVYKAKSSDPTAGKDLPIV